VPMGAESSRVEQGGVQESEEEERRIWLIAVLQTYVRTSEIPVRCCGF
jgi:hypothetical protein